jgi:hypothetical protein
MLIAAGPGVANLKDYTNYTEESSIIVTLTQGDTLPTAKCQMVDLTNSFTITDETDFFVLDEYDPNGWPTVNLVTAPGLTGPYTGGVTSGWSAITTGSGITYDNDPSQGSQRITISNAANSTNIGISQTITLPKDELSNPIIALPYGLSFWVLPNTSFVGATIQLQIDWYNAASTFLSTTSKVITPSLRATTWDRFGFLGTPPATAAIAKVSFVIHTTSATNSGSITLFGGQFEYATFGNVKSMAYPPYIESPKMDYFSTGGVCDGWFINTITGATFSVVTTPVFANITAQSITLSNATNSSSANIWQYSKVSPYGVYTISMTYQIPSALVGCRLSVAVVFYDSSNTVLSTVKGFATTVPVNIWNNLGVRIGPGTGNVAPAGTDHVGFQFGLDTTAATNSGQVIIGEVFAIADPITQQLPNAAQTALQAGMYHTAYCDAGSPGCHSDTGISGLAYRQFRFFGGYIRTTSFDYFSSPERRIDIDAVGYGILLQESPANLLVRNMQDTAVIAYAFQYAQSQGFLVGVDCTTFVQPISQIDSLTWNWADTKTVLTDVANLTIADYWVDEYKFLHYQPSLATQGPYGFSDQPNFSTTYPMFGWRFDNDSTQSVTTKVFEGGNVLSLPQTQSFHGVSTTLNAGLTSGNTYTSITVVATTTNVDAGTILTINNGTNSQEITVSNTASSGATTLQIVSFVANDNYVSTNTVKAFAYLLNAGIAIYQVTSATVNAVAQSVGVAGINTFAQGYLALVDTNAAIITFNTQPPNGQSVVVIYTYLAPVIVRVRNGGAETIYGPIRRRIHHHQQDTSITSITTAIVRSQSELYQYSKARPIGKIISISPPAPLGVHVKPGMSVAVTHQSSGLVAEPFQVQRVAISYFGPGRIRYELDVGFYRLDLAMLVYQGRQQLITTTVNTQGTIIADVLSINDGWTFTDNLTAPIVLNVGKWAPPTVSTWDDTSHTWG